MKTRTIRLLSRAAEELAVQLEIATGYPDNPSELLRANPEASSVITEIFRTLIDEGASVPAPVANLVVHLQRVSHVVGLPSEVQVNAIQAKG